MTRVVVSGTGVVTPFGWGVGALWSGLCGGRTALAEPRRFRAECWGGEPVGEVPGATAPAKRAHLEAAVAEALASAGLPALPSDALVVLVGQAPADEPPDGHAAEEWADFVGPAVPEALGGRQVVYLTHACASAAFGIGFAREAIRTGLAEVVLVAGGTALNRYEYASMRAVRAVGREVARPFDRGRGGISLGEGGGAVVVEAEASARRRGAPTDVAVVGASCGVGTGKAAASEAGLIEGCVRAAVADAGVDRLDYVHAHATGTPQGDREELAALEAVAADLGLRNLPVDSHKGAIGHLLHVSGLPAVATAALALRTGAAPGTPNLRDPEATDRLHLPTAPVPLPAGRPTTALVTSFGFGSNNAALVLSHG
ncbi:beta-ketoacyl synthase N-terminal-like domain-containing protein [Actinosynnema sp. NPDC053489]|uniref:beta-ketoacyl synthase N-terminal-like domain-containing protein n=1 Tax=Actinosynnema sp. NPDC053489 TaxID=3363916 RepID=UPI0037C5B64A